MSTLHDQYDDAMFDFSMGDFANAITKLRNILAQDPEFFDAQLSLGMAYCRQGDFAMAIVEGHKAEKMQPNEPLVHTNLSLFYMRAGDKKTAEHHGLQARIASWRGNLAPPPAKPTAGAEDAELQMAQTPPAPTVTTTAVKFPETPWKNQPKAGTPPAADPPPLNKA